MKDFKFEGIAGVLVEEGFQRFAKFQQFLRSLKAEGILDNDDYKQLYPSSTGTPAILKHFLQFVVFLRMSAKE